MDTPDQHLDYKELAQRINDWSKSLGFQQLGITDTLMDTHEQRLMDWLVGRAREQGCDELHLDSGVQRYGAHRFYLRYGMDITSHHFRIALS